VAIFLSDPMPPVEAQTVDNANLCRQHIFSTSKHKPSAFSLVFLLTVILVMFGLSNIPVFAHTSLDSDDTDDTALPAASAYLSSIEAEVLAEINLVRTDPQKYADYLEATRGYYAKDCSKDCDYKRPGATTAYKTLEGIIALDDAIKFLRATKPMPPLTVSFGMSLSARDHIKDLTATMKTGHKGSDGSLPDQRVNRYGKWETAIAENITYCGDTAREIVIEMLIDDGNPPRGHRSNLFKPEHTIIGISRGGRSAYGMLCVINFAGAFREQQRGASQKIQPAKSSRPVAVKF